MDGEIFIADSKALGTNSSIHNIDAPSKLEMCPRCVKHTFFCIQAKYQGN